MKSFHSDRRRSYLEVDDDGEDEDGGEQVHQVGQVLSVEGFAKGAHLVVSGGDEVEESDDRPLELRPSARVDRRRTERFPDDRLADVRGDEQRDARAESVAFLQQFVEEKDDQTGDEQLDDDQKTNAGADVRRVAVHARHHVDDGLSDGDDHAEQLLRAVEQSAVLRRVAHLDDLRSRQQLHDQTRRDDRRDAQLHQRAAI